MTPTTRIPMRLSITGALATMLCSFAITPIFQDSSSWFFRTLLVLTCCVGAGILLRRIGARPWLAVLGQVVVLTYVLLAMSNSQTFAYGLVPTPATLQVLGQQMRIAANYSMAYAAPVPSQPDLILLVVICLAIAGFVVDLIVSTLRMSAWAGLVLLSVYSVPTALQAGSVSLPAFVLGALGYILLLAADGSWRIRSFGRPVGLGSRSDPDAEEAEEARVPLLGSTGRRIGFAAVALAAVVPLLLPTLTAQSGGGGDGEGDGPNTRMIQVADPTVDLNRDLRRTTNIELFRYSVKDEDGKNGTPDYLRMVVLDDYTGSAWRATAREVPSRNSLENSAGLPVAPGLLTYPESGGLTYSFSIGDSFTSTWLPLAYPARSVDVLGDWRYDDDTYDVVAASDGLTTKGLSYTEKVPDSQLSIDRLNGAAPPPAEIGDVYTEIGPSSLPPEFIQLTNEVAARAGAQASNYAKAVAIQNYFRTDYEYSLDRSTDTGTTALMSFIEDKSGYCQQFAATMALMARQLGIPARVVVGFTPGEKAADGSYVVRSHDAHSWPELYFSGSGWVRFEPTPAARTGDLPSWTDPRDLQNPTSPTETPTATATGGAGQDEIDKATAAPGGGGVDLDASTPWWRLPLLAAGGGVLAIAVVGPGLVRWLQRRRRLTNNDSVVMASERAWQELLATAADLGIATPADRTVRQTATLLARNAAGAEQELADLAALVEQSRYSLRAPAVRIERAGHLTRKVVAALAAPMSRGQRLRARLLPASLLRGRRVRA